MKRIPFKGMQLFDRKLREVTGQLDIRLNAANYDFQHGWIPQPALVSIEASIPQTELVGIEIVNLAFLLSRITGETLKIPFKISDDTIPWNSYSGHCIIECSKDPGSGKPTTAKFILTGQLDEHIDEELKTQMQIPAEFQRNFIRYAISHLTSELATQKALESTRDAMNDPHFAATISQKIHQTSNELELVKGLRDMWEGEE